MHVTSLRSNLARVHPYSKGLEDPKVVVPSSGLPQLPGASPATQICSSALVNDFSGQIKTQLDNKEEMGEGGS